MKKKVFAIAAICIFEGLCIVTMCNNITKIKAILKDDTITQDQDESLLGKYK